MKAALALRAMPLAAIAFVCIACQIPGSPQRADTSPTTSTNDEPRQLDAEGRPLPFRTAFPRRWNSGNDGTTYEPCTSVTADDLSAAGAEPASVRDAALVDFQTARGCIWFLSHGEGSIGQTVGNHRSLDSYVEKQQGTFDWKPEIAINNRRVGVATWGNSTCGTYVMSGAAIVATTATGRTNHTQLEQICDKVVAFTRATIDQMPE